MLTDLEVEDTSKEDKEESLKQKFVIVFDIDGVLCTQSESEFDFQCMADTVINFKDLHPECPTPATFGYISTTYYHYFPPYLDLLFNYLINNNCRIVFFSAASEERNILILEKLLSELFSEDKYSQFKATGQFKIFSSNHLRPRKSFEEISAKIKDVSIVLQDDENINNSVLIEDQPSYAAFNTPCITALNLYQWDLLTLNDSPRCFVKNNTYYLLGIFSDFFNNKKYLSLSLKDWSQSMYIHKKPSDTNTLFVRNMISLGLQEVAKHRPNAIFYGNQEEALELTGSVHYKQHAPSPLKF